MVFVTFLNIAFNLSANLHFCCKRLSFDFEIDVHKLLSSLLVDSSSLVATFWFTFTLALMSFGGGAGCSSIKGSAVSHCICTGGACVETIDDDVDAEVF